MSARRATRPELALTDVRAAWTPHPGDRVRRAHQTSHRALAEGTARVLAVRDAGRLDVAVDPRAHLHETQEGWQVWAIDDVRLVRETDQPAHEDAATPDPTTQE